MQNLQIFEIDLSVNTSLCGKLFSSTAIMYVDSLNVFPVAYSVADFSLTSCESDAFMLCALVS